MSFLFKSKSKNAVQPPPQSLPPASRNVHTSDGTTGAVKAAGSSLDDRKAQSPPPNVGANGSLNSLTEQKTIAPMHQQPGSNAPMGPQGPGAPPAPFARRDRAGSEAGVSRIFGRN